MMRMISMVLLSSVLAGCAHQSTTSAPASAKAAAPFVEGVGLLPVRAADSSSRSACGRGVAILKGMDWKKRVATANACVQSQNWSAVETIGQQLAQNSHLSPWGSYYLSLAAEARQDFARAHWMIELALKKAPQEAILVYQQGRLYWLAKDQVNALKNFNKALDLNPKLTDAHLLIGQLALLDNKNDEAARRFERVLSLEMRNLGGLLGAAEVKVRKSDYPGAVELLATAIYNYPSSYRARLRQAQVYEVFQKNFTEALNSYRKIQTMERQRSLDASVDFDLMGKIRELEVAVKNLTPQQLSLREPAIEKKVAK